MTEPVNSYLFCGRATARIARSWIERERDPDWVSASAGIPWTPLRLRGDTLSECTVAFVSSAGIAMLDDEPFDQEGERRNPWWGDPSFRVIPRWATEKDVRVCHLHINPEFAYQDLNCVLPLQRLQELVDLGETGRVADEHYSFMGYILDETELMEQSVPAIIAGLQAQEVDAVVLVPV